MSKSFYDPSNLNAGVPGVRFATKADEDQIFALLVMLHNENGLFSMNPEKVRNGIRWATERRGGIIYVIEKDNRLVATLGMTIACDWYSDDEYLLERWTYVHPEYRRTDCARRLVESGKCASDWFRARGKNLPFQCGINTLDRMAAKVRLYARHMPCIGACFMYGHPLRQVEKFQAEVKSIEETNRQSRRDRSVEVRPAVETIIRVSEREGQSCA